MKTRAAVVIILALGVVVLAAAIYQKHDVLTASAPHTISIATSTITASTTEYTVDASYPQFGISGIDAYIKADVEQGIDDLTSQATQDKPYENRFPQYNFTSQFSDVYIGDDYVSAALVLAEYTGGAHEQPVIVGENFDRVTGQRVTLDEALALTGRSLDQVAQLAKQQLAQDPDTQPTGMWASGSDPTTDNYSTFRITKDAVVFTFQPYQVAPYSAGAPAVTIPRIK